MHASMAIYNAWCDRVPVLLLGATGPVDATKRRPWIDWIHTARDQGALVRGFVKWDDQPASVAAAFESLLRAAQIARPRRTGRSTSASTPVQEKSLDAMPPLPDVARFTRHRRRGRPRSSYSRRGSCSRRGETTASFSWAGCRAASTPGTRAIALAETLGARVLTDLKVGPHSRPTTRCTPRRRRRS